MSETSTNPAQLGASSPTPVPGADDINISLARITQTLDVILERQDGFNERLGQVEHAATISTTPALGQGPTTTSSALGPGPSNTLSALGPGPSHTFSALGPGPTPTSPAPGPGPTTSSPPSPHPYVTTRRQGRRVALPHQTPSTPPSLQNQQAWQPSGGPWGQAASTPWRPSGTSALPSIRPAQERDAAPNTASATASTNDDDGVTPLQVFRAMPREDKETFRRIMGAMGTTTRDFLGTVQSSQLPTDALQRVAVRLETAVNPSPPTNASELGLDDDIEPVAANTAASVPVTGAAVLSTTPALPSTPDRSEEEPLPPSGAPPVVASVAPAAVVATPPPARPLICRPEVLGEFKGDPYRLEAFLSRVRDMVRSNKTPGWNEAVMSTIPIVLKDDAAAWHEGITLAEAESLTTYEAWADAMREAFPVNTTTQRREARAMAWKPTEELSIGYYFRKLLALRTAYGHGQSDAGLVTDIKDGFPTSFVTLLRIPRTDPTLQQLRKEMAEAEPEWRALTGIQLATPTPASSSAPSAPPTMTSPAVRRVANPSMVRSASAPALPAAPVPSSGATGAVNAAAARYDPARITPAKDGERRKYTRANGLTIELRHPCTRCQGDHFNFEHDAVTGPQVRTIEGPDDTHGTVNTVSWYDDPEHGIDPQHFTSSAMTKN